MYIGKKGFLKVWDLPRARNCWNHVWTKNFKKLQNEVTTNNHGVNLK